MASAGGTWLKATAGPNVGQYVFVPAMKSGSVTLKGGAQFGVGGKADVDAIIQGGLAVHKSADGTGWTVTHVGSGMAMPGHFSNKTAAIAAMEELNSNYKWTGTTAESVKDVVGLSSMAKNTLFKYDGASVKQANEMHLTPKQIQQAQKGQPVTATATAAPKIKAAAPKETAPNPQKAAEAEFDANATGNHFKSMKVAEGITLNKTSEGNYKIWDKNTGEVHDFQKDAAGAMAKAKELAAAPKATPANPQKVAEDEFNAGAKKLDAGTGEYQTFKASENLYVLKQNGKFTVHNTDTFESKEFGDDAAAAMAFAKGKAGGAAAPAAPAAQTGKEWFDANAKTAKTGTKTVDMGEDVLIVQKGDKGWNAGKILTKEVVDGQAKWKEHANLDEAKAYAEQAVNAKKGNVVMQPVTPATPTAKAGKVEVQYSTKSEFDANAKDVQITTLMGKTETAKGVVVGDGSLGVTFNEKTSQYHVVDVVSGKTLSKYDTAEQAFNGAKIEAKNSVSVAPPQNGNFKPFSSAHAGEAAMKAGYKGTHLDYDEVKAIKSYQGSPDVNSHLWKNDTNHYLVKPLDSVFSKAKLPENSVLIRAEGKGHPLYDAAKYLNVGDKYQSKGYDSTSLNPNHTWGSSDVKIVYRAPKGIPAVYCNAFGSEHFSSEYEVLLGRNLSWNVVGKAVHGSSITLTVEYDGIFK